MSATLKAMLSSKTMDWESPRWVPTVIHEVLVPFDLDAAANAQNTLLPNYLSKEQDALLIEEWPGHYIWVNPPYGKEAQMFAAKMLQQHSQFGKNIVALTIPRFGTQWFDDLYASCTVCLVFEGRLQFTLNGQPIRDANGKLSSNTQPSCLLFFGYHDLIAAPANDRIVFSKAKQDVLARTLIWLQELRASQPDWSALRQVLQTPESEDAQQTPSTPYSLDLQADFANEAEAISTL